MDDSVVNREGGGIFNSRDRGSCLVPIYYILLC